nr:replication factor A protein 1-like [Ipomoea batatas]
MPSKYVSVQDISPLHTRRTMRLRLVRTYEVPEIRGGNVMRSEVRITSSYDATKLWINHSFDEFLLHLAPSDIKSGSITVTTLADLMMQEEDGDFYVPAWIVGIEGFRKGDWYNTSCKSQGCSKKRRDKGLLICGKCNKKWEKGCVRHLDIRWL